MSIESSLERIAVALERLTNFASNKPAGVETIPCASASTVAGPVGPTTPLTSQALKLHAIEMSKNMTPEETKNFTAYVRGYVCSRFGVQKLVDVPADQVEYAMGELKAFDKTQDYSPKKGN